jgi:medium-chain acyl-[acyl-carrier-protein] hydrolase
MNDQLSPTRPRTDHEWFQRTPQTQPRGRLFCFAYAGGSALVFRTWAKAFSSVEVTAVQLPGRENRHREKPLVRMHDVVAQVVQALVGESAVPFAFFGYSLGSLIAFETARALRRANLPLPRRMFVAASPAPQHEHLRSPPLHRLNDADLIAEMRRFKGTPEAVLANRELLSLLLPVIRADFELLETYVAANEPPLPIPFSAYGGIDDAEVAPDALADWSSQTSAEFSMRFFPGDHFFLKTAQEQLLAAVAKELESTFPAAQ